MAHQSGVRRVRLALIQQGLKPSRGSIEEEGFDSVSHILFYHSAQPSELRRQQETLTATDAKAAKFIGSRLNDHFNPLRTLRPSR